jgi:hypothetical protein
LSGRSRGRGQTLVFVAVVLPLVLLPVAAYATEAALLSTRHARLQAVAAQAAEDAVQQLDEAALRSGEALRVDPARASELVAGEVGEQAPEAVVDEVTVSGAAVTVRLHERLPLVLAVWIPGREVTLRAQAQARLRPGYESPSSLLAFPTSTFWSAASGMSSVDSSSRQRSGWMNG